jgi:hypothetical protein
LACPYYLDDDYLEYFACCTDDHLEDSVFQPHTLLLSPSSAIHIVVEKVFEFSFLPMFYMLMASLFKVEPSPMPAAPFESYQSPPKPASPLPSSSRKRKHASSQPLDPTAEWLRLKASQQPHYQFFVDSHHRTLQNAEIVIIWRFAAGFHDIYYQAKCDTTVCFCLQLCRVDADLYVSESSYNQVSCSVMPWHR